MPLYEFEDPHGAKVEVFLPMDEAPDFGETIVHEGKELVRVLSISTNAWVDHGGQSVQGPRWDPLAAKHDKKGRPQFNGKREARDYTRRYNDRLGDNRNFTAFDVE